MFSSAAVTCVTVAVVALVGGLCILGLVFRRWKNASLAHASDEDFAIVEAAFLKKNDVTDDENV